MSRIGSFYLTDEEHEGLERLAATRNVSKSSVVRIALRLLLGLPVPPWARDIGEREVVTK